ncbi:helix-turn-helix domain-containing protein [Streptomyces sp. G-G2]|uniref:helix-turn-helix domain-containing protein n=1 Tax=Streptomyces sp. G-G2 TaxID=3046201 RepID=UPI0024BA6A52|nr:helix-turn-helix domain-containing protein [Streptomyces sp. G-G2]MDJ0382710.1 helix-turn-helix domain-containing protein [Streptomyces sp. G-G2]
MTDLLLAPTRPIGALRHRKDPMSSQESAKSGRNVSPALVTGQWRTTDELARILNVDPSTLRRWRTSRPLQGPPFVPVSDRVTLYSAIDVEHWLRSRRVDPEQAA